jgi:hypothetical protein
MVMLIGWIAVVFTLLTLLFSGLMLALEVPPLTCLLMALSSALPGIIAVACLIPSKRFIAVRIIGIAMFLAGIVAFVQPFIVPAEGNGPFHRLGIKLLLVGLGASMAITGKWSDAKDESDKAPDDSPDAPSVQARELS